MPEHHGRSGESEVPDRKRRPPLVSRDQAVDTAYRLVDEDGPTGLSMRRLAGALHVSLPTVYTAIDSRESLVEQLFDRLVDEIASALGLDGTEPDEAAATADEEDLRRVGRALLEWTRRKPNLTTFLLAEEIGPGVAERATTRASPTRRANAAALVRGIAGPASSDVDPIVAVMAVVAESRAALWLARQERLATVGAEHWIDLGCSNVARALRSLAELGVARRG